MVPHDSKSDLPKVKSIMEFKGTYVVACRLYNGSETKIELKTDKNMTISIGIN